MIGSASDTACRKPMKMAEKEAHISVRHLTMAYGDFVVMRNLTFDIKPGGHFHHHGRQWLRQKHLNEIF